MPGKNIALAELRQRGRFPRTTHEKIFLRSITAMNLGQHTQVNELDARNSTVAAGEKVARDPTASPQNVADTHGNWPEPGALNCSACDLKLWRGREARLDGIPR